MKAEETGEKTSVASRPRRRRIRVARTATVLGVLAVYVVGVVLSTGLGSLSAFGIGDIAAVCPVGALETMIAGRIVLPLPLIAIVLAVLAAVCFGRAFCSWVCPVPLTRKLVTNKRERDAFAADRKKGRLLSKRGWPGLGRNGTSALGVLGVALATTLVFGFPVFCLVCPIGLAFATLFALVRLAMFNELVVDLVVFPALIVFELVVLRKWCATLCPVGAFLGLFARFNRTLVPTIDEEKCLATATGTACDACHAACSSDIDLVRDAGTGALHDCTKCHECADHCPASAITFPWRRPKASAVADEPDRTPLSS
ncbi:hypothetical protein B5F40_01180 [Gordonibacter sp. An230]|uniref:4Fe-4S binding protein n=1 Tax=Gordonibacter sp. An230 TaxID=1965592 RepID=UPI000B3896FF|nr:4Fe-4S binding protein [Gordonibacter sp. An230]OUO92534.1 hypothetical protein B5F40_01180 [Gordonibacter sp. An230]